MTDEVCAQTRCVCLSVSVVRKVGTCLYGNLRNAVIIMRIWPVAERSRVLRVGGENQHLSGHGTLRHFANALYLADTVMYNKNLFD